MIIKTLGATREVGRSAFLLQSSGKNIVLDYGVLLRKDPVFPLHIAPKDVDGVILSHAHLDHSGAVPLFSVSSETKTYCTKPTLEIADLLLRDFVKISQVTKNQYIPFEYDEITKLKKNASTFDLNQKFNIDDIEVTMLNAGHIPGSSSILIESEGKRIVYTGDINSTDMNLIEPSDIDYGEIDLLITESTYGNVNHIERSKIEEDFVEFANHIVENGGNLLVPAFSIGRSQEILCVLEKYNFSYPIIMDGMALKMNRILIDNPDYLKDAKLFIKSVGNATLADNMEKRKKALQEPSVIIAPAGMLVGGSAQYYYKRLALDPKNGISIVSYQIPGTPGRRLLDQGKMFLDGKIVNVRAQIKKFDFSSHSGNKELMDMFKKIKGDPLIIPIHGEEKQSLDLADEIQSTLNNKVIVPNLGEEIEI
ncbi:MAG: MBL fold metallo-hydrolase [Thermoproteota archaeon]